MSLVILLFSCIGAAAPADPTPTPVCSEHDYALRFRQYAEHAVGRAETLMHDQEMWYSVACFPGRRCAVRLLGIRDVPPGAAARAGRAGGPPPYAAAAEEAPQDPLGSALDAAERRGALLGRAAGGSLPDSWEDFGGTEDPAALEMIEHCRERTEHTLFVVGRDGVCDAEATPMHNMPLAGDRACAHYELPLVGALSARHPPHERASAYASREFDTAGAVNLSYSVASAEAGRLEVHRHGHYALPEHVASHHAMRHSAPHQSVVTWAWDPQRREAAAAVPEHFESLLPARVVRNMTYRGLTPHLNGDKAGDQRVPPARLVFHFRDEVVRTRVVSVPCDALRERLGLKRRHEDRLARLARASAADSGGRSLVHVMTEQPAVLSSVPFRQLIACNSTVRGEYRAHGGYLNCVSRVAQHMRVPRGRGLHDAFVWVEGLRAPSTSGARRARLLAQAEVVADGAAHCNTTDCDRVLVRLVAELAATGEDEALDGVLFRASAADVGPPGMLSAAFQRLHLRLPCSGAEVVGGEACRAVLGHAGADRMLQRCAAGAASDGEGYEGKRPFALLNLTNHVAAHVSHVRRATGARAHASNCMAALLAQFADDAAAAVGASRDRVRRHDEDARRFWRENLTVATREQVLEALLPYAPASEAQRREWERTIYRATAVARRRPAVGPVAWPHRPDYAAYRHMTALIAALNNARAFIGDAKPAAKAALVKWLGGLGGEHHPPVVRAQATRALAELHHLLGNGARTAALDVTMHVMAAPETHVMKAAFCNATLPLLAGELATPKDARLLDVVESELADLKRRRHNKFTCNGTCTYECRHHHDRRAENETSAGGGGSAARLQHCYKTCVSHCEAGAAYGRCLSALWHRRAGGPNSQPAVVGPRRLLESDASMLAQMFKFTISVGNWRWHKVFGTKEWVAAELSAAVVNTVNAGFGLLEGYVDWNIDNHVFLKLHIKGQDPFTVFGAWLLFSGAAELYDNSELLADVSGAVAQGVEKVQAAANKLGDFAADVTGKHLDSIIPVIEKATTEAREWHGALQDILRHVLDDTRLLSNASSVAQGIKRMGALLKGSTVRSGMRAADTFRSVTRALRDTLNNAQVNNAQLLINTTILPAAYQAKSKLEAYLAAVDSRALDLLIPSTIKLYTTTQVL
eukprot:g325.t1